MCNKAGPCERIDSFVLTVTPPPSRPTYRLDFVVSPQQQRPLLPHRRLLPRGGPAAVDDDPAFLLSGEGHAADAPVAVAVAVAVLTFLLMYPLLYSLKLPLMLLLPSPLASYRYHCLPLDALPPCCYR